MRIHRGSMIVVALWSAGCSRFVLREEPYRPDPAPVTETILSGRDTTYVARGKSYYLVARDRELLWRRDVVDDVAWRYRWLFGEEPPEVAIVLDTARARSDTLARWRDLPVAVVRVSRRERERSEHEERREGPAVPPTASLALRAAEVWIRASARALAREPDNQPGGPSQAVAAERTRFPAWFEIGSAMIIGSPAGRERASDIVRNRLRDAPPLATLFGVAWPGGSSLIDAVRAATGEPGPGEEPTGRGRGRPRAPGATAPPAVGGPLFVAQATSVLAFMRERDPRLVAALAGELSRGRSMAAILATGTVLARDVAALDAEWRRWVRRRSRA